MGNGRGSIAVSKTIIFYFISNVFLLKKQIDNGQQEGEHCGLKTIIFYFISNVFFWKNR